MPCGNRGTALGDGGGSCALAAIGDFATERPAVQTLLYRATATLHLPRALTQAGQPTDLPIRTIRNARGRNNSRFVCAAKDGCDHEYFGWKSKPALIAPPSGTEPADA